MCMCIAIDAQHHACCPNQAFICFLYIEKHVEVQVTQSYVHVHSRPFMLNQFIFLPHTCTCMHVQFPLLTAAMDGFLSSPAGGWVTSAPMKMTGLWNTVGLQWQQYIHVSTIT